MTPEENCIVLYSCCILWMQNRIQCIPVCIPHKNIYLECIPSCIPKRNIYSTVSLVLSPPRLTKSELQKCIVLFLHCILMSATTSKDTVYSAVYSCVFHSVFQRVFRVYLCVYSLVYSSCIPGVSQCFSRT